MKKRNIRLADSESIVAVVPEYARGPGWANRPLWVYICDRTGKFRTECIQPEEQTATMLTLFGPLYATHNAMLTEVNRFMGRKASDANR